MIQSTLYETDPFLLNKKSTLIEYSAFCGSTRIFKFFYQQEVDFTPSLFHYSIHSNNLEIFQMLEKYLVNQTDIFLNELLIESIKCHHNQITNYIFTKFSSNHNFDRNEVKISIFKYHNYAFLPTNFDDPFIFYLACFYNYVTIVENLLKTTTKTNLNKLIELPNKNKQTALHGAIDKNNFEIVNLLIQ
ncbi:hypothetical protein M9Y10_020410 [Tritrichomonas musculus]|uniref:DUF3447 domain-containing protein n=1 Tax=Tritrichomonas musculus TaxID=1915356 RepID=A0ABR2HH13_9EUKA